MALPPRMSHVDILKKAALKRAVILEFLAVNKWITAAVAARLLNVSRPAAMTTINAMERAGEIKRDPVPMPFTTANVFGITAHGLALAGNSTGVAYRRPSPNFMEHQLCLQCAQIAVEDQFGTWEPGPRLRKKGYICPDGFAHLAGGRYAIEIERSLKNLARYHWILVNYGLALLDGNLAGVYYLTYRNQVKPLQNIIERSVSGALVFLSGTEGRRENFADFADAFLSNVRVVAFEQFLA